MQKFHNILFVSHGIADETDVLNQALSLARNNKATLKALIICPQLPSDMVVHKDEYETSLKEQLLKPIQISRDVVMVSESDVRIQIEVASCGRPVVRIIQHVLKNTHDIIIKEVESKESSKGFKEIDMELLRKFPCPVWLCRPIKHQWDKLRVTVAIDPQSEVPEGNELSLQLLALSRSLARSCNGELNIISCWDHGLEVYFRHNFWFKVEEDELQKTLTTVKQHYGVLEKLIRDSGIFGKMQVHHLRERPEQMIPQFIDDEKIDIFVMGTAARTGIPGFIIGNRAENVLQKIGCSLVALKPIGFISQVKTY
jgi:nucleotide-binding universal stress UspA family protein